MNDFRHHMQQSPNVVLHVGELAYGDRPFEVTSADNPNDVQLRTTSELFHKENIQNLVINRFPAGWQYGACIDADFTFTRHDWALEAVHQLQHYSFVQLFSSYATLSASGYGGRQVEQLRKSFVATYQQNGYKLPDGVNQLGWTNLDTATAVVDAYADPLSDPPAPAKPVAKPWIPVGATGGAWAFTKSAINTVGGLLDQCILGHADWFMAFGLVAESTRYMHDDSYHPHYTAAIGGWQSRAGELKQNVGVVDGFVVHHYHGNFKNRAYGTRDLILVRNQFDPVADIRRNSQGVYELTPNKPKLRDEIRQYFISRSEDN